MHTGKIESVRTGWIMKSRLPWFTLAVATLALVACWSSELAIALQWDRAALAQGEAWRLVTGHVVHWTTPHLVWDLVAFVICGAIAEPQMRGRFAAVLVVAALAISLAMLGCQPGLERYRGLSGLDSALFAAAAITLLRRAWAVRSIPAVLVPVTALTAFVVKTIVELATQHSVFVTAGSEFVSLPLAHLVGAMVGACAAVWGGSGTTTALASVANGGTPPHRATMTERRLT